MPQDFLHKLIYAFISGLTEFLPVGASAHQMLYSVMTGYEPDDSWLTLSIHLGMLIALLISCKARIKRLSNERRLSRLSRKRRNRQPDTIALLDIRVLKTAAVPILLSLLLCKWTESLISSVILMTVTALVNGVMLFIPRLLPQGNKDSRALTRLDSILIGLGGALGVLPGISGIGGMLAVGLSRGVDRHYILDTALLLSIPVMVGLVIIDVIVGVAAGVALSGADLLLLVTAALSFGGAFLGITLMRHLSVKTGFAGFAYYGMGLALLLFIIYLMI